jgi:hypothetical protein
MTLPASQGALMAREPAKISRLENNQPLKNELLLALSRNECQQVFAEAEFVDLPLATVLNEVGQPIPFGYIN